MSIWYSVDTPEAVERFTDAWGGIDAPTDETGAMLLEIAKGDVLAYAPEADVELGEDWELNPPSRFVFAQLQQAKNPWNAGRAQDDSTAGTEGYSFVPRPLDKTIKALIRPKEGVPYVV